MSDALSMIPIVLVGFMMLAIVQGRFQSWEQPWLYGSLAIHFVAAVAEVLIVTEVYGGGDMFGYHRAGVMLARFLQEYPVEGSYRLFQVIFQLQGVPLPMNIMQGTATGAMQALSGYVVLLVGGSIYGACALFGLTTFFSKLAIYRVLRREFPRELHMAALISCLWVPSVIFWGSALLKEAVAITGLGMAFYGGHALATGRRRIVGFFLLLIGLVVVAPVKAYLLPPFGIAAGIWLYLDGPRPPHRRRARELRPGAFLFGLTLATLFVIGIGELFPRFNPVDLAEHTAQMQRAGERVVGGSDYTLGNTNATVSGQLKFAPLAILTALFRPTLLEAHNAQVGANALESTIITVFFLMALVRCGVAGFLKECFSSPILGFCAVFSVCVALGVGLGSSNLGSLSRYRMPFFPFFVFLVVALSRKAKLQQRARAASMRPTAAIAR